MGHPAPHVPKPPLPPQRPEPDALTIVGDTTLLQAGCALVGMVAGAVLVAIQLLLTTDPSPWWVGAGAVLLAGSYVVIPVVPTTLEDRVAAGRERTIAAQRRLLLEGKLGDDGSEYEVFGERVWRILHGEPAVPGSIRQWSDEAQRLQRLQRLVASGGMTPNQAREALGMPPRTGRRETQ